MKRLRRIEPVDVVLFTLLSLWGLMILFPFLNAVDNETYLSLFPGFTLIDIPIERMGYKCLELTDQTINGKIIKPRSIKVDFSYC